MALVPFGKPKDRAASHLDRTGRMPNTMATGLPGDNHSPGVGDGNPRPIAGFDGHGYEANTPHDAGKAAPRQKK